MTQQAHLYPYSSAAAHLANDPTLTLRHKHQTARVRLYLDRWRKEFEVNAETNWATWLYSPRQATFLQDVARLIGQAPGKPMALAFPALLAPAASAASRGS
jgi:hypothetical protein